MFQAPPEATGEKWIDFHLRVFYFFKSDTDYARMGKYPGMSVGLIALAGVIFYGKGTLTS